MSYVEFAEMLGLETRVNIDWYYIQALNTMIMNGTSFSSIAAAERSVFIRRNVERQTYQQTYQEYWIHRYMAERELAKHQAALDTENRLQRIVIDSVVENFLNPDAEETNGPISRAVIEMENCNLARLTARFEDI